MSSVTGISDSTISGLVPQTSSEPENKSSEKSAESTDFEKLLTANLSPNSDKKVSEEQLFAALVPERLKVLKGEEAVTKFNEEFTKQKSALKKGDGFIPYEDAAKNALKALVGSGDISAEDADKVYSQAFSGAQLDGNANALFDDRGGAGDTTIAVDTLENALLAARVKIVDFDSGKATADIRSLLEASAGKGGIVTSASSSSGAVITPSGTTVDGQGGFLFKPESSTDGKLAIIAPEAISAFIDSIVLKDLDGNVIEEGRFTSMGDEGIQAKYAFSQAGGSYPDNIRVEIRLSSGEVQTWEIPDPSKRYD